MILSFFHAALAHEEHHRLWKGIPVEELKILTAAFTEIIGVLEQIPIELELGGKRISNIREALEFVDRRVVTNVGEFWIKLFQERYKIDTEAFVGKGEVLPEAADLLKNAVSGLPASSTSELFLEGAAVARRQQAESLRQADLGIAALGL